MAQIQNDSKKRIGLLGVLLGALALLGILFLVYSADKAQEAKDLNDELAKVKTDCQRQTDLLLRENDELRMMSEGLKYQIAEEAKKVKK